MGSAIVLGTFAIFSGVVGALNMQANNKVIAYLIIFNTGLLTACSVAALIASHVQ